MPSWPRPGGFHWPRPDDLPAAITGPGRPATMESFACLSPRPAQAMFDKTRPRSESAGPGTRPRPASAKAHGTGPGTEALSRAVDSLSELLVIANSRADWAEQRADTERARGDQLQTELSQAQRELIEERRR